jgi:hypothetical protein
LSTALALIHFCSQIKGLWLVKQTFSKFININPPLTPWPVSTFEQLNRDFLLHFLRRINL